jgi:integrase/recombinase XerD
MERNVWFLTGEEMKILLSMPDPSTRKGLWDMVLMAVLYDSTARVLENPCCES